VNVIVACGAAKRTERSPAWQLYTGPYFRACMAWADSVTSLDRIHILSARYGLVPATQELDPYEQRLDRRALPVEQVRSQAARLSLRSKRIVFCGGRDYERLLTDAGLKVTRPFAGPRMGQGKQIGLMRSCLGHLPTEADRARYAA
jgi:Family of unknown function (DUF6884)